ncbi:MAG: hypothetical protein N2652_04310 [Kiritimatiellae bacterium]|nr:hypothetical protein [Kiritimatiellia bacterium]
MKIRIGVLIAALGVAACDHRVPLSDQPSGEADRLVIGAWVRSDGGGSERMVVLPMGRREWLVVWGAGSAEPLYARAWPVRLSDATLAQLEWLGSGAGKPLEGDRPFQLASWTLTGRTLTVRLIKAEVGRDAATSAELAAALEEARRRGAWTREPMVFTRTE